MTLEDKNSTRAGRSIDYLDDRKDQKTNPGDRDPHGNREPDYKDDILEAEEKAALDHIQISGAGDVAEDGEVVGNDLPPSRQDTGQS